MVFKWPVTDHTVYTSCAQHHHVLNHYINLRTRVRACVFSMLRRMRTCACVNCPIVVNVMSCPKSVGEKRQNSRVPCKTYNTSAAGSHGTKFDNHARGTLVRCCAIGLSSSCGPIRRCYSIALRTEIMRNSDHVVSRRTLRSRINPKHARIKIYL